MYIYISIFATHTSTMKTNILLNILAILLFANPMAHAQTKAADYMSLAGPIAFSGVSYSLSWSSHPNATFYKQEYLAKGENPDRYKTMLMFDAVTGVKIEDAVGTKINELKQMKQTNPVVNYKVLKNNGEYILDFILSQNKPGGKAEIVERNVYRYKTVTNKGGKKAVLLFGVSTRSYGNDVDRFLRDLKATSSDLVNKVAAFTMPAVSLK